MDGAFLGGLVQFGEALGEAFLHFFLVAFLDEGVQLRFDVLDAGFAHLVDHLAFQALPVSLEGGRNLLFRLFCFFFVRHLIAS